MKFHELTIIPEDKGKPIKIAYEDNTRVTKTDDFTIEFVKELRGIELENFLKDVFGTTKIGIFDCRNMHDEEIERIINE